jgi:NDP-sugar pyrophosphorylase family protein
MVAEGKLAAMATNDYWIDTGRPDTYLQANLDLIDGTRAHILSSIAPHCSIDSSASVVHSVVGEGSTIGAQCVISDSVLLPGADIGQRVRLERCLIMGSVGDDSSLVDCVVGADGVVARGSALVAEKVPSPELAS